MNYNDTSKPTLESTLLNSISGALVDTHTNLIAKITKVNAKTIDCKPVISRLVNNQTVELPVFVDVPVINFLGGTSSIQMPLVVGDYCVLYVIERCFDSWYVGEDFKPPLEVRMHDYSDSVALVGLKNLSGELDIPTVIKMMGDCYQEGNYEHLGDRQQIGNYELTGDFTIVGDTHKTGNLTIIGNITITGSGSGTVNASGCTINLTGGDVVADGISLKNHRHSGVQTGGSNTGLPL